MSRRRYVLLLVVLPGCAYYNGMYNAKRWASQAEHSERAGRSAEAHDRWQRAVTHADSLLARHPRSRWADDAQLVRGRALLHLGAFERAADALTLAGEQAGTDEQRLEALLLLGQAQLARGRHYEARAALDRAATSGAARRRAEALLFRGRLALAEGDPETALRTFRSTDLPAARWGRAHAALALRDTALAGATADTLAVGRAYVEATWLPFLDSLAAAGARLRAAHLVDTLVRRADVGRGQRARLLLGDGERALAARDAEAAARRFLDIRRSVPDSAEARSAAVRLVRLDVEAASADSELAPLRERLLAITRLGGAASREAQQLMRLLDRADTLSRTILVPDAFWFLRAELLRDSIGAPGVAAAAFAAMAERFPRSPWTPKALLAAIAAGHPEPDSLRSLLEGRYATSPYTLSLLAARADASGGFELLEDSLRMALATRAVARRGDAPLPGAGEGEQGGRGDPRQANPRPRPFEGPRTGRRGPPDP